MSCLIRPMQREDIPQVIAIDREAFASPWPPPNYQNELQNKLARYIVAGDDTRVIEEPAVKPESGHFAWVSRLRHWLKDSRFPDGESLTSVRPYILGFAGIWLLGEEAHITNLAVRKCCQRQGTGELLLYSIIELATEFKASVLTLEVRASNTGAQNLYRKYGFNQAGLRRAYYTDNREDGVIMTTGDVNSASFQSQFQKLKQEHLKKQGIARYKPVISVEQG